MTDPTSSKTTGYHLFLEPTGSTVESLKVLMAFIATDFDAPIFTPHVTVLSRIESDSEEDLIEQTRTFAASIKPFDISLGEVASEDRYFRALYLHVQEEELMTELHWIAAQAFSMKPDEQYLPHLSLLYGSYPIESRERVAE